MDNLFNSKITGMVNTEFDFNKMNDFYITESVEARKALQEIKRKKNQKTIEEEVRELQLKFKREESLYEEYDNAVFTTKLRLDSLFYESILSNLPEETTGLEEAVASFYKTVRNLYEVVNIKPESHKLLNSNILVESINDQEKTFKKIIREHLNNKYYKYTLDERKEKYLDKATPYAEELIREGVNADEAIGVAIKTIILESLVKNIAIPRIIQSRINYLCEDADYGKVFDQEHLKSLWTSFNNKATDMAKILAISI